MRLCQLGRDYRNLISLDEMKQFYGCKPRKVKNYAFREDYPLTVGNDQTRIIMKRLYSLFSVAAFIRLVLIFYGTWQDKKGFPY